jgi:hypothetical protein
MAKARPQSRPDLYWRSRQQIPDAQIANAADQFETASELLSKQPPLSGVLLPELNCAAVSIELYLKCLSAERIYNRDPVMPEVSIINALPSLHGHALVPLFEMVNDELRKKIAEEYDALLRSELKDDFITALSKCDGAFMDSRYSFEPGVDISKHESRRVKGIAKFLRDFVHSTPTKEFIWR